MITIDYDGETILTFEHNPDVALTVQKNWPTARFKIKKPRGWILPGEHLNEITSTLRQAWLVFPTLAAANEMERRNNAALLLSRRIDRDTEAALAYAEDMRLRLECAGFDRYAHQVVAIDQLVRKRRLILADDMGLGKTLSGLVSAYAIRMATKAEIIVLSPASVMDDWRALATKMRSLVTHDEPKITVHSWAKLPEPPETPYVLIADEAHFAANGTRTIRGRGFIDLARSKSCIAAFPLTGTPIPNGDAIALWPLLYAVAAPVSDEVLVLAGVWRRARDRLLGQATARAVAAVHPAPHERRVPGPTAAHSHRAPDHARHGGRGDLPQGAGRDARAL